MNKKGFTLIQMAAIIMVLGIALVVAARHFSVSNVTESVNRYSGEINDAERELKLFLAKYHKMPNYIREDNLSFMEDNETSTTPELYKTFRPRNFFRLMYVASTSKDNEENWNGDICAILPHTAPYTKDTIIPPNDNYSVNISYCEGKLDNLTGKCDGNIRMTLTGMMYAIVHPGDDGGFQSRIVGDTLYVPAEGNDDLVRYLSVWDAYDMGECSFRVARVPRQDPRYHNAARFDSSTLPPSIRTWVSVEEHLAKVFLNGRVVNGSDCITGTGGDGDYDAETLDGNPALSDTYGGFASRDSSPPYNMVKSCTQVHLEYPVNRLGEVFKSEKCCIELNDNWWVSSAYVYTTTGLPLPQGSFTSNCQLVFNTTCPVDGGKELKGQTPYVNIITNPFTPNMLGAVPTGTGSSNSFAQGQIPARLKITFRNGNRLYRIDDEANIIRVEFW